MASRLLSSSDSAAGETAASRETTPLKGVH